LTTLWCQPFSPVDSVLKIGSRAPGYYLRGKKLHHFNNRSTSRINEFSLKMRHPGLRVGATCSLISSGEADQADVAQEVRLMARS
jgi:hypothetical protein